MTLPDPEFDPDDNFAHGFHAGAPELDDDASGEALTWQLLLLINPGDEEAALQQFTAWQEASGDAGDEVDPLHLLADVIDWKSGFRVEDGDPGSLIDSLAELAARWNLRIDWAVEDPTDAEFLTATNVGTLIDVAYDRLREYGYTLWTWHTGSDSSAGWITRSEDDDAMRAVAAALRIEVQPGAG